MGLNLNLKLGKLKKGFELNQSADKAPSKHNTYFLAKTTQCSKWSIIATTKLESNQGKYQPAAQSICSRGSTLQKKQLVQTAHGSWQAQKICPTAMLTNPFVQAKCYKHSTASHN